MIKEYILGRDGRPTNSYQWVTEPEDDEWIKKNYGKITAKDMAKKYGISGACMKKILDMLIPTRLGKKHKLWTPQEDEMLIKLYQEKDERVIASIMGRNRRAISNRARFLNLRKKYPSRASKRDYAKDLRTCCGRFCEKRESCQHYSYWLNLGKPQSGQLNQGCTTRCIQEGIFKDFLPNYDNC